MYRSLGRINFKRDRGGHPCRYIIHGRCLNTYEFQVLDVVRDFEPLFARLAWSRLNRGQIASHLFIR
jgi:hypothetical protein